MFGCFLSNFYLRCKNGCERKNKDCDQKVKLLRATVTQKIERIHFIDKRVDRFIDFSLKAEKKPHQKISFRYKIRKCSILCIFNFSLKSDVDEILKNDQLQYIGLPKSYFSSHTFQTL